MRNGLGFCNHGRNILSNLIDLATVARPDMPDAIAFHGEPIVVGSHDLSGQQGSTGIGSKHIFSIKWLASGASMH